MKQQAVSKLTTQVIHKNMTLKHSGGVVSVTTGRQLGSAIPILRSREASESDLEGNTTNRGLVRTEFVPETERPLAVLLTWLAAKESHIEKYRSLWLQKGFDVLTVKMTPYQLLLPKYGSIPLVRDLVKFLVAISDHYPDLLLHCFSVGAYEFGEMMYTLNDKEFMESIRVGGRRGNEDPKSRLEKSIKGVIFDSAVNLKGIAAGVSRSITGNEMARRSLEASIHAHLSLSHSFATKYYERASEYAHSNYLTHAPGLLLVSDKDSIGAKFMSEQLIQAWRLNGIHVDLKVFPDSGHVQHLPKYPEEYLTSVDTFLKKVPFQSISIAE